MENEKIIEQKDIMREKTLKSLKEIHIKKSQMIYQKNFIRKQKQEENLRQVNERLEKIRNFNISRFKDSKLINNSEDDINFPRLKTQIEFEIKYPSNKNIFI